MKTRPPLDTPLWTITALTIPSRVQFLKGLLDSLVAMSGSHRFEVTVIYNAATLEEPSAVEQRIRAFAPSLDLRVYLNTAEPSIGGGRRVQLAVCRTPLIAFVDDDLTLHGDVLGALEYALSTRPLGIVGLPSYEEDSSRRFKPRESTPYVDMEGVRYMPVQGMLVAGYRRLFGEIGGFNPRRQFWGEWTELNLRMWRHGFPTGYIMDRGFLRHWHKAPESPTRNMSGRERHVLWGLMCTAIEYDAVSINEATEAFWRLAQDRYLAYSYGEQPTPKRLLASVLELMPRLSQEWGAMRAFADDARQHPFQFMPFEPLTVEQVRSVIAHADASILTYRPGTMASSQAPEQPQEPDGWMSRMLRAATGRKPRAMAPEAQSANSDWPPASSDDQSLRPLPDARSKALTAK